MVEMPIFCNDASRHLGLHESYHVPNLVRDSSRTDSNTLLRVAKVYHFNDSDLMGNGLQKYGITRQLVSTAHHEPDASTLVLISSHPELLTIKNSRLGGTVWHYAAKQGNTDLLHALILFVVTRVQETSLQQQQRFLALLLNQSYGLGDTPLMLACAGGHANAASLLLQHGADPQKTDRRGGHNCLHIAAAGGHAKVVQVILQTVATFPLLSNSQGYSLRSVSQSAAAAAPRAEPAGRGGSAHIQHPAAAVVQQPQLQPQAPGAALLDSGEMYGLTPLHLAICKQRHEAVAALLQAGASLSTANTMPVKAAVTPNMPRGTTPLHTAVRIGDQQIVLQILACHLQRLGGTAAGSSADPRLLRDDKHQLPWHVAKHLDRPSIFCELLNPTAPLREQLQLAVQGAGPALNPRNAVAVQRASSATDGMSNSLSANIVHLRSLQEIAALQLKQSLLQQAARVTAAAGVHLTAPNLNDDTATSGPAGLSRSSGASGPSAPQPQECGVCMEAKPLQMLSVQPCSHLLCLSCYRGLVELIALKPAQCPFCRTAIAGCAACELQAAHGNRC